MTAPSRARAADPVLFGAPPGRKYIDELPPCALLHELYGSEVGAGVFEAPSVTTIIKGGSPTSWALRNWDKETVARYGVNQRDAWLNLKLPDGSLDVEAAVDLIKNEATRSLGRAADRGTDVHKVLELKAKGLTIPDIGPGREGWMRAVERFWLEHAPIPVWVEVSVYRRDKVQPYAGTLDLIAWLRTGPNGEWELWLIDLKTGKGVYGDMALQQAAYRYAHYGLVTETPDSPVWRRERIPRVQRMGILNAHEDGSLDLVELYEVDEAGVPATEHFSTAYESWQNNKRNRSFVGARIPVPGRLEVELASSLLLQRMQRLPRDWAEWLSGMWPADTPRPGAVMRKESVWTAAHVEDIDRFVAHIEAECQLPLEVPPRMDPAEMPPSVLTGATVPVEGPEAILERDGVVVAQGSADEVADYIASHPADPFKGLPDMGRRDPLTTAAEEARNVPPPRIQGPIQREANIRAWSELLGNPNMAPSDHTPEEWDEMLLQYASAHDGRLPLEEAHYRDQMARVTAGGYTGPPEQPRADCGLTERQAEQWLQWREMVLRAEDELPSDLWADLQGWAAAESMGNVKGYKPSPESHRQLELLAGQVVARRGMRDERVDLVTRALSGLLPPTNPEDLDGEPDPQLATWGHLIAMAMSGDDTLVDRFVDGGDFLDFVSDVPRLTHAQAMTVVALVAQLGALNLHLGPDGENDGAIRIGVNTAGMAKALEGLGLGARELTKRAKELALEYRLPHRPRKASDVLESPILSSLLLASR